MRECDIVNTRRSIKLNDLYLMNSLVYAAEMVINMEKHQIKRAARFVVVVDV